MRSLQRARHYSSPLVITLKSTMPRIANRRSSSLVCRHSHTISSNGNGASSHSELPPGSKDSCNLNHAHDGHHHHHDEHSHYPDSAVMRFLSEIGVINVAHTLAHSGKWTLVSIASFVLAALAGTELAAKLAGSTVAHAMHYMALSATFLLSGIPQVRTETDFFFSLSLLPLLSFCPFHLLWYKLSRPSDA